MLSCWREMDRVDQHTCSFARGHWGQECTGPRASTWPSLLLPLGGHAVSLSPLHLCHLSVSLPSLFTTPGSIVGLQRAPGLFLHVRKKNTHTCTSSSNGLMRRTCSPIPRRYPSNVHSTDIADEALSLRRARSRDRLIEGGIRPTDCA